MSIPTIPHLSTDLAIFAVIGLTVTYGVMAGQIALTRLAASIYVGLVLATYFAQPLQQAIGNTSFGGFGATQTVTRLVLLFAPVVLLQLAHHRVHGRMKNSVLAAVILGALVALLMIAAVFLQLDDLARAKITGTSNLASWIYDLRLIWLGAVPVAMVVIHFLQPRPDTRKR